MPDVYCDQFDCIHEKNGQCFADKITLKMWIAINLMGDSGKRGLWCEKHEMANDREK